MGLFNSIFNRNDKPIEESYQSFEGFSRNDNSIGLNSHLERFTNKYVNFGDTNQYPNYLNDLYNSSGLHSAIIDIKRTLIVGEGYELEGTDHLTTMQQVELKQFTSFVDGTRDLEEVLDELAMDYMLHGTIYLKIFWNSDKTRIIKFQRIEPSTIRLSALKSDPSTITRYYHNPNWAMPGTYPTTEYAPYNPSEKDKNRIEIYRFRVPNSAMLFYTLPSYAAATNWINLDGEISTYHKSNIENAINPSMTIKFYKKPANEEEKRKIVNGIKKQYTGAQNTGKAMIFFSDDKETAPDIDPVQVSNIDKQFNVTADAIQRNICYAHKINPMILGLKTPGSLGNSAELDTAFEIFQKAVIQPAQRDIEGIVNRFLKYNGLPVKLKLNDVELFTSNVNQNPTAAS